jgi:hypothetical protein
MRDLGQGQRGRVLTVDPDPACDLTFVAAGHQAIDAADEGSLAAAARAGNEEDFTRVQGQRDVSEGRFWT